MTEPLDWADASDSMLNFAKRWAPFDGDGDENILIDFGVTPCVFYRRLQQVLAGHVPPSIDKVTRVRLQRFCARRLAVSGCS